MQSLIRAESTPPIYPLTQHLLHSDDMTHESLWVISKARYLIEEVSWY